LRALMQSTVASSAASARRPWPSFFVAVLQATIAARPLLISAKMIKLQGRIFVQPSALDRGGRIRTTPISRAHLSATYVEGVEKPAGEFEITTAIPSGPPGRSDGRLPIWMSLLPYRLAHK
jgi:hypothetical protein